MSNIERHIKCNETITAYWQLCKLFKSFARVGQVHSSRNNTPDERRVHVRLSPSLLFIINCGATVPQVRKESQASKLQEVEFSSALCSHHS
jgi:hypothetical protein